ncbi:BTAD domain-containing putative transcriptional regulator [Nocardioides sp.]|uniref:AfsR/SARP family transcriptional regulator n=1 Tax=Nocardioides sp. TaxID=35761 RepID=UPI0019AF1129|nr:BTAD domain-containing putative transcriptional regulator [Nocardioides sp.]MBC7277749.1 winged helix-turn-helix domain-containing protein [Nocardioides sp.]
MTDVSICLLGPLLVSRAGELIEVPGRRPRTLLALLAMEAGTPVSADLLADRIWGEDLPDNPRGSLHTYIGRLRRVLGKEVVRRAAGGYILDLPRSSVDALAFVDLLDGAQGPEAYERLEAAIELWRADPFDDSAGQSLAERTRPWLVDRYLAALEHRAELDIAAGRAAKAVADVRRVVGDHPLRESLWAVLLDALDAAGRTAEALEAFEEVRARLADELGTDPGAELRSTFTRLLSGASPTAPQTEDPEGQAMVPAQRVSEEDMVPRQLPADIPSFSGREAELRLLDAVTISHDVGWPSVVAVHGIGAVGKTALAVHWARSRTEHFPDGQLFIDLRGYGPGEPLSHAQALTTLLIGLGVDVASVPAEVDAASALLRTTLAGRRMLLVLDNARDSTHVRPLLPGSDSLALVTSRSQLRGLATREGARRIALDTLAPEESVAFLKQRLVDRSAGEADIRALADRCGHLPLALAVAAERCSRYPDLSLTDLLAELDGETSRLAALEAPLDPVSDLRAVFSWSYDSLDEESRRAFRLLGLRPGHEIGMPAMAALFAADIATARRLVDKLVDANLVREHRPGRFVLHDLIRDYALELGSAEESGEALRRLLSWYSHSLVAAAVADRRPLGMMRLDPVVGGVTPLTFATAQQARSWGDREWLNMGSAVRLAAGLGLHSPAYQLVNKILFFAIRHPPSDTLELQEIGVDAALRAGEFVDAAYVRNQLGITRARAGDLSGAISDFRAAAAVFREAGEAMGLGMSLSNYGQAMAAIGAFEEAVLVLEEAHAVAVEAGLDVRVRNSLIARAEVYVRMGRYEDALALFEGEIGTDPVDAQSAAPGATLIDALIGMERYDDAEKHLCRELARHTQNRNRWSEARLLFRRAKIERKTDRGTHARETLHEVLGILDEVGELDHTELTREEVEGLLTSLGAIARVPEIERDPRRQGLGSRNQPAMTNYAPPSQASPGPSATM